MRACLPIYHDPLFRVVYGFPRVHHKFKVWHDTCMHLVSTVAQRDHLLATIPGSQWEDLYIPDQSKR